MNIVSYFVMKGVSPLVPFPRRPNETHGRIVNTKQRGEAAVGSLARFCSGPAKVIVIQGRDLSGSLRR